MKHNVADPPKKQVSVDQVRSPLPRWARFELSTVRLPVVEKPAVTLRGLLFGERTQRDVVAPFTIRGRLKR